MLLRAAANAAALAFLTWSTPAMPEVAGEGGAGSPKGTWFAMPDAWTINWQKYYIHWLIFSLWEPAMMRVSVWKDSSLSALDMCRVSAVMRCTSWKRPLLIQRLTPCP